jgi:hypothetical protein
MEEIKVKTSLLHQILQNQEESSKNQKKLAREFAQLSMDFSAYKNKKEIHDIKVIGYLENNEATGQQGLVKDMADVKAIIKSFDKKIAIFATGIAVVVGFLKFLLGKISFAKLFI